MFLFHTIHTPNTVVNQVICSADILLQIMEFSIPQKNQVYGKELLNSHNPLPLDISLFLDNEII